MVAIVTAMEREAAPVRRLLQDARWGSAASLHVVGVGREAAAGWAATLKESPEQPEMLLTLGFAGGIRKGARAGNLLIATHLYALGEERPLASDSALVSAAEASCREAGLRYHVGEGLTVPNFVGRAEDKARLAQASGAWAINMEDYWLAAGAAEAGIPFLTVRAVADEAERDLPCFVGSSGDTVATALRALARRPWLLPSLTRLARQAGRAQASLVRFAEAFLPRAMSSEHWQPIDSVTGAT